MEDLNLASLQTYKIEVHYTQNKVLNSINFTKEEGGTSMACGSVGQSDSNLIVVGPGMLTYSDTSIVFKFTETPSELVNVNSIQITAA